MTQNNNSDRLERSPIANISLASKELFHSNFLAWAFSIYPTMLNAVLANTGLPTWSSSESVQVTREEQSLDLVARIGENRLLVIENKLKSLPDAEQLSRYEQKATKLDAIRKSPELVLLTLTSSDSGQMPSLPENWQSLDYGTLTTSLLDHIPADADSYHVEIIRDYALFVGELVRVANDESRHVWNRTGSRIDGQDLPTWLTKHKLHDLFGKRQGQIVAAKVHEHLAHEFGDRVKWQHSPKELSPSQINIYSGFSNSEPLVGVFCALSELRCPINEVPVGVGFQVQGNRFRSYVEWPKPGHLAQIPKASKFSSKTAAIAWDLFCDNRCPPSFWPPGRKSGPKVQGTDEKKSRYHEQCRFGTQFQYRYKLLSEEVATPLALDRLAGYLIKSGISLLDDLEVIESLLQDHQSNYPA